MTRTSDTIHSVHKSTRGEVRNSIASALSLTLAAAVVCGCGKSENAYARGESRSPARAATSEAAVELSESQLNAIKIEPVGSYAFPIIVQAVGSVSFEEDPAVVQTEATLLGAAATFDFSSKELARVRALGATNGIAQKELEQVTSDHQTAQAALKAARDALRALGKTDHEIDGMIAAGRIPAPSRQRWVVAYVSEDDSRFLRARQNVQVTLAAWPGRVFEGRVFRVNGNVDPTTHRETIRCVIADSQNDLRPGMLADVAIRVREPVTAPAIPSDGVVRESDGTTTAWVTIDRHRFVQRIVKTGLRSDGQVEILEGLKLGELAVTEGAVFLSNMINVAPGQ